MRQPTGKEVPDEKRPEEMAAGDSAFDQVALGGLQAEVGAGK